MKYFTILIFCAFNCFSQETIKVRIVADEIHQTIDGFGASDAWRCQFVGKNWPLEKREQIADLLFSKKEDKQGNPKGIALSMWRFNIGAGSAEQGDSSGIKNSWRRVECFLNQDGTYNWQKQSGEQWFLNSARKRGVKQTIGFVNSPPVFFTKNGKAFADKDVNTNLRSDVTDQFSAFLTAVSRHFKFDYISPVNEPQWDWADGKQEGNPAMNEDIFSITKSLSKHLNEKRLKTKITVSEAGSLAHLYKGKPNRQDQIDVFWNPESKYNLRRLPNVAPIICGHSYFTTWPLDTLINVRTGLNKKLRSLSEPPKFWQSEFCILEKGINEYGVESGPKRDLGINTALYFARVIHHDLVDANAASWQFWTALTDVNFKDGLIYLDSGTDKSGKTIYNSSEMQKDGFFHASKTLWMMGNYSRFVRPGMQRVGMELNSRNKDIMVSAYHDAKTKKLVLVVINYSDNDQKLELAGNGFSGFTSYTTSADKDLKKAALNSGVALIGKRSIVTLVGKL